MRLCVNGHWLSDDCRCLEFWQGEACDLRDCGPFGTRNDSDHGFCHCNYGYAGEFCEYKVCIHRQQWYCNATRTDSDASWLQERHLCPPEIMEHELPLSTNETFSHCGCGYGTLSVTGTANSSCVCQMGYYGEFCQWSSCPRGEIWDAMNKTCVSSGATGSRITNVHLGYFGYDINTEFDVSAAACLGLILLFVIIGRIALRCLKKRQTEDEMYVRRRRSSTFTEYYDRFHRFPHGNGVNPKKTSALWKSSSGSSAQRQTSNDKNTASDYSLPKAPLGPVQDKTTPSIVVIPYQQNMEYRTPRSISVPLETVYEGVPVISRPRSQDEDEIADQVQDEKFRESMINFARQISSDMSDCSSTADD